jgi:hypothetical protein
MELLGYQSFQSLPYLRQSLFAVMTFVAEKWVKIDDIAR